MNNRSQCGLVLPVQAFRIKWRVAWNGEHRGKEMQRECLHTPRSLSLPQAPYCFSCSLFFVSMRAEALLILSSLSSKPLYSENEYYAPPPPNLWVNVYISRAYSHKNRPSKMTNIASSTTLPTPSTVPKFIVKNVLGKLYHTSITWLVACRIVLPSWWYMIFEIQVKTISKKQCHNCLCNPQKRNSFKLQFNKMWKHQRDHDQIEWRRMSTIIERTKL